MKRIVLLIVMLMGVVTVAQERIPRLIPRDYNNVPAAVPVWYDTTTGTYKYYQDNSASMLDALSGLYPNATGSSSTTYSRVDTAATTSDSVSTSFTSNYFDILNNGSVAIYFCTDVTFGDNKIVVPAYASYRWSVKTTRIHYKTLTSTAEVYIIAQ